MNLNMDSINLNNQNSIPKIIIYPNPILLTNADWVKDINGDIENILGRMVKAMEINNGIGLAAPQIGVPLRLITVKRENWIYELINPKISWKMGNTVDFEGCLSLPGEMWQLERAAEVVVEGIDKNGNDLSILADGLLGRIFQHEVDHLDGVLINSKSNLCIAREMVNAQSA